MRKLMVVLAVSVLAACQLTLAPLPDGYQDCGRASSWSGSSCHNSYSATVINIGPTLQYTNNADLMCYQFSPTVVTVKVGASYTFQNNTSSSITIMGANQGPWVTVDAGSTSAALTFSAVGVYTFAVQGCRGLSGTPWYGVLNVTIN
jgi:plastocyanin